MDTFRKLLNAAAGECLRLLALGLALCLVAFFVAPGQAHAVLKTQYCLGAGTNTGQGCHAGTNPGLWQDSKSASCNAYHSAQIASNTSGGQPYSAAMGYTDPQCQRCLYIYPNYGNNNNCTGANGPIPWSYHSYATREVEEECVHPLIEVNGECVDKCSPKSGQAPNTLTCTGARCGWWQATQPTPGSYQTCSPDLADPTQGCTVSGTLEIAAGDGQGGWNVYTNSNTFTGQSCTPGATENPEVPDSDNDPLLPPPGKCAGTVNGVTVFVDCETSITPSTPRTNSRTTSTSEGETTTETTRGSTTTCVNGVCTTTTSTTVTVTVTPSGGGTGTTTTSNETETETQSQGEYCEENPAAAQCGEETTFGGTCQAGAFSCSGDAVQCAAAKAVNESKCLMTAKQDVIDAVGTMAAGTYAPDPPTTTVSVAEFNQANPFGSSCPTNHTVSLAGASISIPLSAVCSELQMMGNLLVAFTLLAATIFVLRGLGGS